MSFQFGVSSSGGEGGNASVFATRTAIRCARTTISGEGGVHDVGVRGEGEPVVVQRELGLQKMENKINQLESDLNGTKKMENKIILPECPTCDTLMFGLINCFITQLYF